MELKKGELGPAIRSARKAQRLSQEALAERLDITVEHMRNLESERRNPSIEILYGLSQILNLSIDAVFFPERDEGQDARHRLQRRINALSPRDLEVLLAAAEAMVQKPEPHAYESAFRPERRNALFVCGRGRLPPRHRPCGISTRPKRCKNSKFSMAFWPFHHCSLMANSRA